MKHPVKNEVPIEFQDCPLPDKKMNRLLPIVKRKRKSKKSISSGLLKSFFSACIYIIVLVND